MQCLLKIGLETYLLPTDKGAQTVLGLMSKARRVSIGGDKRREEGLIELEPGLVECSLVMLPGYSLRPARQHVRANVELVEPELLPPAQRLALEGRSRKQLTAGGSER